LGSNRETWFVASWAPSLRYTGGTGEDRHLTRCSRQVATSIPRGDLSRPQCIAQSCPRLDTAAHVHVWILVPTERQMPRCQCRLAHRVAGRVRGVLYFLKSQYL